MLVANNSLLVTSLENQEEYIEGMINSFKIDFGKLKHCRDGHTSRIVFCSNQECGAVLSRFDSDNLITRDVYLANKEKFGPQATITAEELGQADKTDMVWICRYCNNFQLVDPNKRINLLYMPTRYTLEATKNAKAQLEPIILFVIDYSSSMEGMVCEDRNGGGMRMSQELLNLMNSSELVKKSKQYWKESMARMLTKFPGGNITRVDDTGFVTKKNFMLALLSKALRAIDLLAKSDQAESKRKIGFIFFNEIIFLMGDGTNSEFPIIHHGDYDVKGFSDRHNLAKNLPSDRFHQADFGSFQDLYNKGSQFSGLYKTNIKDLNHEKMDFSEITSEGKTALGPALAVALGIVSKHGEGSSIVVVTDGIANYGILEAETPQPAVQAELTEQLKKEKCLIGILQWNEQKDRILTTNNKPANYFNKFVDSNRQLLNRYEVNVGIDMETIDLHIQALEKLAFRKVVAVIRSCQFHCSADFITIEKTKFEQDMLLQGNLITSNKWYWMEMKINKPAIKEQHYLQPVITQLILRYQDVASGTLMCFISQMEHRLSKNVKRVIQLINFDNIQEYFDSEDIHNFSERCTIRNVDRTYRESIRNISESMKSRKMHIDEIHTANDATSRSFRRQ